jgi:BirA family biotin operon repressor/biotin-[acetyl-CoA-carboxylase] ligase
MSMPTPVNWSPEEIWLRLVPLLPGLSIEVLPSVPSSNTLLLDRLRSEADVKPCLLVAEEQTAGRGRLGRQWVSQAGASLTFSLALPLAPQDWAGLSLAVGLALAEALDPAVPGAAAAPRVGLKWPNDLWLMDEPASGRKLGGILIETVNAGGRRVAVIGIGLNLLPLPLSEAQEPLSHGQASLSELDPAISGPQALLRVVEPLVQALLRFEREGFAPLVAAYARRDVLRGQPVSTTLAEAPAGIAQGVDAQGALLLQAASGLQRVVSGEVSVRLNGAGGA